MPATNRARVCQRVWSRNTMNFGGSQRDGDRRSRRVLSYAIPKDMFLRRVNCRLSQYDSQDSGCGSSRSRMDVSHALQPERAGLDVTTSS
jgi:hypothetical protein